ncbi:KH domain-containing protein [Candidatus Micrarchaeota archaeon]|nr:KH domain-containing protein [Candidatus Micrarchaeota archaeon]
MNVRICELCMKSNVLCSGCEEKLKRGKISELDVKISRLLYKMKDKYNLENADFTKAIDLGRVVLVLTHKDVGLLIGREGKVVSEISQAVGKKVRIAEMGGDIKKTIADVVAPAKILGINKIYKSGGYVYKVRFSRREIKQLPVDINTLEKALKSLLESEVMMVFE